MASTGLEGPWALTTEGVVNALTAKHPGAYVLGRTEGNTFLIGYVGRADADLKARMLQHAAAGKYAQFKASYMVSALAAFQKECELFHNFGEFSLDNDIHPARPAGSSATCPYCLALG